MLGRKLSVGHCPLAVVPDNDPTSDRAPRVDRRLEQSCQDDVVSVERPARQRWRGNRLDPARLTAAEADQVGLTGGRLGSTLVPAGS